MAAAATFPSGKLPGDPNFTDKYYNMSQGEGDTRGPWNGEKWESISDGDKMAPVDSGDGLATVKLSKAELELAKQAALRTRSDPSVDPIAGAELGAGPGAGENAETARDEIDAKLL